MSSIRNAALLALGAWTGLQAQTLLSYAPVPLDVMSEGVITVVNSCHSTGNYRISAVDTATGETVLSRQGQVSPRRSVTFVIEPAVHRDAIVATVWFSCPGAERRPLSSFTIRERHTRVPRYPVPAHDGPAL